MAEPANVINTDYYEQLEEAMVRTGARFDTTEHRIHGAPNDLSQATGEQLANASGIAPGRQVLNLPGRSWPATPATCTDYSGTGEWVLGELILVCRGCGLDCT